MRRKRGIVVAAAAVLAVATLAGAAPPGAVEVAGASHGPESANFTVEPMSDRSPGAENVRYGQRVVATAGTDLQTLEKTTATYEDGSFESCGPSDGETFGIDRGSTHAGYEIDHDLTRNVKSFTARADLLRVEFYDGDDFGSSTYMNDGDEFVSVSTCIDNPDEPGWYRISGTTTGVTDDGERVTFSTDSHYFWICDCETETEAREELGPPPSEPQRTTTPTPTATDDGGADDGDSGGGTDDAERESPKRTTVTPTNPPAGGEATATAESTDGPTDGWDDADDGTAAPTDGGTTTSTGEWDDHVLQTPTAAEGPGFGPAPALVAILATVGVLRRRG
jgi:PGF-CTERM protein